MATFPYAVRNDLTEFTMIAGTDQELYFNVYNSASALVDLSGASITWNLGYFGQSSAVVTKSGTYSGSPVGQIRVGLAPSDTASLDGKFLQQYQIVSASGSTYRPSQGIVNIIRKIS